MSAKISAVSAPTKVEQKTIEGPVNAGSKANGSSFKEALEKQQTPKSKSNEISPKKEAIVEKFVNDFSRNWSQIEKTANIENSKLSPELKNLFSITKSANDLHLKTQLIERLAEAFSSSVKSLQKAAGG